MTFGIRPRPLYVVDSPTSVAPQNTDAAVGTSDQDRLNWTIETLHKTQNGREIADFLAQDRVKIRVMDDADYQHYFPGSGAAYDPKTKTISLQRGELGTIGMVTTLAHEGKHAFDYASRPPLAIQQLKTVGATSLDAAKALVTLHNPLTQWMDSLTARQNEDEVAAYHLEAQVAQELGINESAWAYGQAKDGSPLPLDEVRANIATDPLYRMDNKRRLVLGGAMGLTGSVVAGIAAQGIAKRVAKDSFLAQHGWPVIAVGAAMSGAWVLADQMRSRRLEDERTHSKRQL